MNVLICDMLLAPHTRLVAWTGEGERLHPSMIGRRALLAGQSAEIVLVLVPEAIRAMSAEELALWYKEPGRRPRRVSVRDGRVEELGVGMIEREWAGIIPDTLRGAWREAGIAVAPAEAELEASPGKEESVILVEGAEILNLTGDTVTIEEGIARGRMGDAVLALQAEKLAIYRATPDGVSEDEEGIRALDLTALPEPWASRVREALDKRVGKFKQNAITGAAVEEVVREGREILGLIDRQGEAYAPLVSWGNGAQVVIRGSGRAIVVEDVAAELSRAFVPVGAKYGIDLFMEGLEGHALRAVEIYRDGGERELSGEEEVGALHGPEIKLTVVRVEPQRATVTSVNGPEEGPEGNGDIDKSPQEIEEAPQSGSTGMGEGEPEEYEGYDFDESPMLDEDSFSGWEDEGAGAPVEAPSKSARRGTPEVEEEEVSIRTPHAGALTVSNWMTIMPRGAVWAAELAVTAADGEAELGRLGCLTQIKLLFKGFNLTRQDKARLAGVLTGALAARIEEVRIVYLSGEEYYVRPQGEGYRVIGSGGREVIDRRKIKKLRELYQGAAGPEVTSTEVKKIEPMVMGGI